jgi:hypothetical protein
VNDHAAGEKSAAAFTEKIRRSYGGDDGQTGKIAQVPPATNH